MSTSTPSDVSKERVYHFSDRSMRRLLESTAYIRYLIELLMPELLDMLDFDRGVQQNRTFLSEALRVRESDVLLRVPFQETVAHEELHICILIEHQSRPDWLMQLRLLIYMERIWESEYREFGSKPRDQQNWSPILPIVFYTGSDRWTAPLSLAEILNVPAVFERFVPTFDTLFFDVKQMESARLTESGHPFGWLLRVLQEEDADGPVFREVLETAVSEINRSEETSNAQLREALNYLILLVFHERSETEREPFVDIIKAQSPDEMEVETMAQTAAESLIEQGIAQGARQMSIESILLILTERFPDADVPAVQPLLEGIADLNRLKQLNRNAVSTRSLRAFREQLEA